MQRFLDTLEQLDRAKSRTERHRTLQEFCDAVNSLDFAWALYLLTGRQTKRILSRQQLQSFACQIAGVPDWLYERCLAESGDVAETTALLMPEPAVARASRLAEFMVTVVLPLQERSLEASVSALQQAWGELTLPGRVLLNRLLLGRFRAPIPVAQLCVLLSDVSGVATATISERLAQTWTPTEETRESLFAAETEQERMLQPFPFKSCHSVASATELQELGNPMEWRIEPCYQGIRCQAVRGQNEILLWSQDQTDLLPRFPQMARWIHCLPAGTIVEGFLELREAADESARQLASDTAAASPLFIASDLLRHEGEDLRQRPWQWRINLLREVITKLNLDQNSLKPKIQKSLFAPAPPLLPKPTLSAVVQVIEPSELADWIEVEKCCQQSAGNYSEGLILKHVSGTYHDESGDHIWRAWKPPLKSVAAVLIYVQEGGRRGSSSNRLELTLGLWKGDQLIPVERLPSMLGDSDDREIRDFVRENTERKFGPVRAVKPALVFELGFRGLVTAEKKRVGFVLRDARILRRLPEVLANDADSLDALTTFHNPH